MVKIGILGWGEKTKKKRKKKRKKFQKKSRKKAGKFTPQTPKPKPENVHIEKQVFQYMNTRTHTEASKTEILKE